MILKPLHALSNQFHLCQLEVKGSVCYLYHMPSWLYLIKTISSVLQTIVAEDVAMMSLFQSII